MAILVLTIMTFFLQIDFFNDIFVHEPYLVVSRKCKMNKAIYRRNQLFFLLLFFSLQIDLLYFALAKSETHENKIFVFHM